MICFQINYYVVLLKFQSLDFPMYFLIDFDNNKMRFPVPICFSLLWIEAAQKTTRNQVFNEDLEISDYQKY